MTSSTILQNFEKHIPIVGDISKKSPVAYRATRLSVSAVNTMQMAVAESYINGLEVPDSVLRSLFDSCMPVFFKYFPSLLVPYEWVL
ncbi:SAM-dependent methyltransferase, partial [Anabaena sp. UHCC 0253]|nr:SAM-dependent methyltransferase [Anabaena sp. UHCC 0253]